MSSTRFETEGSSAEYGYVYSYGMVRYGTVRYGMVRYGTVWYGTVRYGMVRLTCINTNSVS